MVRYLLLFLLLILITRAAWRLAGGVMRGLAGQTRHRAGNVPTRGVRMVRDPVCGTYVVRDRALALADGSHQVFFCSAGCRDTYRARTA
jgi:hypothetical protein